MGDVKSEKICDDMEKTAKKLNVLAHNIDDCIERKLFKNNFDSKLLYTYRENGWTPCDYDKLEKKFKDILSESRIETQEYIESVRKSTDS